MAINLQIFIGTVNYTDYLHVTAAKVGSPSTVVYETWINVPVTNYTLVIPGLDPDDYYISFYDSPDNVSLGTLVSQCFVNARSPEFAYEIRFYEIGNLPVTATLDVTETILTDTYLINKTIESYFKEGFRFLEPGTDIDFDDTTGAMHLTTGSNFETGEKFTITIKYAVGTVAAQSGGIYSGTVNVTAATYTLLIADKNKLVRCVGSAATQVITLPALSTMSVDDGYYFDNSCGGTALQVKLLMNGGDRIRYDGLMEAANNEYAEFWLSKGQHLLIKKFDDDYAEIRTDWKGVCVGEKITVGYKSHPLIVTENGQLMDGDEWPLFWYWLTNILPSTHKYTTDTVTGSFTPDATKPGQFAVHSTLKKWRMPSTGALVEKGLLDFDSYGADTANRPVDYPGGYQAEMLMSHGHKIATTGNQAGVDPGRALQRASTNPDPYQAGAGSVGPYVEVVGGAENRVKNIGVIYARRMG